MAETPKRPTLALVVEDDPDTRALETDVLKAGGFNVRTQAV
jgi:CheY-like chemotaxis protein